MSHPAIMVMGVSGSGKSVVGADLAQVLGARFLEGDDYHPPENVARMAAGKPLTDAMRRPWLLALADAVAAARGESAVVFACSALKRSYRDLLRERLPGLRIVHLETARDLIATRLTGREGHFMPAALLQSQIDTLESPQGEADVVAVAIDAPPREIARKARAALNL